MAKPTTPPSALDEIAALRAALASERSKTATLSNALADATGSARSPREQKPMRWQLNLLGTTKDSGKANSGSITLFASTDANGRSACANGSVSFWREAIALLRGEFGDRFLADIARNEANLKP